MLLLLPIRSISSKIMHLRRDRLIIPELVKNPLVAFAYDLLIPPTTKAANTHEESRHATKGNPVMIGVPLFLRVIGYLDSSRVKAIPFRSIDVAEAVAVHANDLHQCATQNDKERDDAE